MTLSPLRVALYVVGGLLLAGAILLAVLGAIGGAICSAVWAALLLVGLVFERWRYKPLAAAPPGLGWSATDERFVDPETGKLVTVYFNASTGERRYTAR